MIIDTDKNRIKFAPSLLSADFTRLKQALDLICDAGGDWVHVDVMDGQFVPNISIGPPVIQSVRRETPLFMDVHLMIERPDALIPTFIAAGADMVTVHAEACTHLDRTLRFIRESGAKAGVALNPATPLTVLEYVLDSVDMVLLMTVNPGFGGQSFIPQMTGKIKQLRAFINRINPGIDLEIDGGINTSNITEVTSAGANVIVAGSAFFHAPDPIAFARKIREKSAFVVKE